MNWLVSPTLTTSGCPGMGNIVPSGSEIIGRYGTRINLVEAPGTPIVRKTGNIRVAPSTGIKLASIRSANPSRAVAASSSNVSRIAGAGGGSPTASVDVADPLSVLVAAPTASVLVEVRGVVVPGVKTGIASNSPLSVIVPTCTLRTELPVSPGTSLDTFNWRCLNSRRAVSPIRDLARPGSLIPGSWISRRSSPRSCRIGSPRPAEFTRRSMVRSSDCISSALGVIDSPSASF